MARIRTIKPEMFDDPDVGALSPLARWLFVGLLTQADRCGRVADQPKRLKLRVLGFDESADAEALLDELARARLILRYTRDGEAYLQIRTFEKHQRPHPREPASTIPPPPDTARREPIRPAVERHGSTASATAGRDKTRPDPSLTRPAVERHGQPESGTAGSNQDAPSAIPPSTAASGSAIPTDPPGREETWPAVEEHGQPDFAGTGRGKTRPAVERHGQPDFAGTGRVDTGSLDTGSLDTGSLDTGDPEYPPAQNAGGSAPPPVTDPPEPEDPSPPTSDRPEATGVRLTDLERTWNATASAQGWPQVRPVAQWPPGRRRAAEARLREHPTLAWWQAYVARMAASDLLTGRIPRDETHASWRPDFDWALKPSTVAKVLEGKYDPGPNGRSVGGAAGPATTPTPARPPDPLAARWRQVVDAFAALTTWREAHDVLAGCRLVRDDGAQMVIAAPRASVQAYVTEHHHHTLAAVAERLGCGIAWDAPALPGAAPPEPVPP